MALSAVLLLSFFNDKYIQINTIISSLLYIFLYMFFSSYLIIGNINFILKYAEAEFFINAILILVFIILIGVMISGLTYDSNILSACSILIVVYCLLNAFFSTISYFQNVLNISDYNFADFIIIFYQFYAVLFIVFTLSYSAIMCITHTIHLKIIPNIKEFRRQEL
ncbi:MAG: hypothetical protein ACTSRP_11145 [Candidatus Helarchaeota archaeon]